MNYTDEHYMTPGAREALNAYRRNAVIGFLILLVGLGVVLWQGAEHADDARQDIAAASEDSDKAIVQSGRAVSVAGCNRDFHTNQRLRGLIASSRGDIDRYVAEGTLTPAQGKRAKQRINEQIKSYPLPDCRKAETILTSKPGKTTEVPEPLYPEKK